MMILLAAMFQAAPALPADDYSAALRCSDVIVLANQGNPTPSLDQLTLADFFIGVAARTKHDADIVDQKKALDAATPSRLAGIDRSQIPALVPLCAQRFPVSTRATATLPTDALNRDAICAMVSSTVSGIASLRPRQIDSEELSSIEAVRDRYRARLTSDRFVAARTTAGVAAGLYVRAFLLEQYAASLDLGPPLAVEKACAALP